MSDPAKANRREFLKVCAAAGAAGLWVVLIPKPGAAQRVHVIEEAKAKGLPEWLNHYYVYVIDTSKCIGCGGCVRACKNENHVPDGYHRTWVERYQVNDEGHVFVESPQGGMEGFPLHHEAPGKVTKGFFVPKMCNHCRNTPCSQVCPVHASYETPDGVVLVDKKVCIGCGYCVQACPYGSRYLDPRDHTADKCTWCYHRITKELLPACVTVCPTKTRIFGDMKDEDSPAREIVEKMRVATLKPELNTEPYCFYLGLDRVVR